MWWWTSTFLANVEYDILNFRNGRVMTKFDIVADDGKVIRDFRNGHMLNNFIDFDRRWVCYLVFVMGVY